MKALLQIVLVALLLSLHASAAQEPTLTYRADVTMFQWSCTYVRSGRPITDMTGDNFSLVIDKQVAVPITVVQSPLMSGTYHVFFSPPDPLRDGKKHRVDVTVLNLLPKGKKWKMRRSDITFPRPGT